MVFILHILARETTPSPNRPLLTLAILPLVVSILAGSKSSLPRLTFPNGTSQSLTTPNVRHRLA